MEKKMNPLKNVRIEYHILQSFPISCLNRDDVGAPKSAIVGGVKRARVSSQCWKRPTRLLMHDFGVKLAIRSKKIGELISSMCLELGASDEEAKNCGQKMAELISTDTLHFFTEREARAYAEYAKEKEFIHKNLNGKDLQKLSKKVLDLSIDGFDIALFGRMVAKFQDLNIEAAASFSHAISTHAVENDIDFFTALDDLQNEAGAAHMGSLEFNSATYYRYISLDLGQLWINLGGQELSKAIEVFTKAIFLAVPVARQATQSAASPWEFAKIFVRKGQRIQMPFETAIKASKGGGYLNNSINAMKSYFDSKEKTYGTLFGKIGHYEFGMDDSFSIDDLIIELQQHLKRSFCE